MLFKLVQNLSGVIQRLTLQLVGETRAGRFDGTRLSIVYYFLARRVPRSRPRRAPGAGARVLPAFVFQNQLVFAKHEELLIYFKINLF